MLKGIKRARSFLDAEGVGGALQKRLKNDQDIEGCKQPSSAELPESHGRPPVWADKRQSLCSALPYYKGYQSGGYTSNGVLLGSLLDGFPAVRDVIDPEGVIIMNV